MKKIWFKRKRYGWGWRPVTVEGWLVLLAYVLGIVFVVTHANPAAAITSAVIPILILTILMISISWLTGEKPRWQWGKDIQDTNK